MEQAKRAMEAIEEKLSNKASECKHLEEKLQQAEANSQELSGLLRQLQVQLTASEQHLKHDRHTSQEFKVLMPNTLYSACIYGAVHSCTTLKL
jgi:DNA repair exonuclease SbcCD ATPase subunit